MSELFQKTWEISRKTWEIFWKNSDVFSVLSEFLREDSKTSQHRHKKSPQQTRHSPQVCLENYCRNNMKQPFNHHYEQTLYDEPRLSSIHRERKGKKHISQQRKSVPNNRLFAETLPRWLNVTKSRGKNIHISLTHNSLHGFLWRLWKQKERNYSMGAHACAREAENEVSEKWVNHGARLTI